MSKRADRRALRLRPAIRSVPAPPVPHRADLPFATNHTSAVTTTKEPTLFGIKASALRGGRLFSGMAMNAPRPSSALFLLVFVLLPWTVAPATQAPETTARFSRLILNDPSRAVQ